MSEQLNSDNSDVKFDLNDLEEPAAERFQLIKLINIGYSGEVWRAVDNEGLSNSLLQLSYNCIL
jgi:hypothetical protein